MIKIDNKEYRNLQEQVQKNQDDIKAHYEVDRVVAEFGIKVQGRVTSVEDLPTTGTHEYGDAYLVGGNAPYDVYIWTRNGVSTGVDGWLNIGAISIVGPQGAAGKDGKDITNVSVHSSWVSGDDTITKVQFTYSDGTIKYADVHAKNGAKGNNGVGISYISETSSGSRGDGAMNTITFLLSDNSTYDINIKDGLKGDKGERGIQGKTGYVYTIKSTLSSATLLPEPTEGQRQTAYLVGIAPPYHLYVILEEYNEGVMSLVWTDVGTMTTAGASTQVLVNGQFVEEWNADNKLDQSATTDLDMNNHSITTVETLGVQTVKAGVIKDVAGNNPVLNCDTGVAMLSSIQNNNGKSAITFSTTNDSITITQPLFGMSGIGGNNVKASDYLITDDIKGNDATRAIGIYNDIDMEGKDIDNAYAVIATSIRADSYSTKDDNTIFTSNQNGDASFSNNVNISGTLYVDNETEFNEIVYHNGYDIKGVSDVYADDDTITIRDSERTEKVRIDGDGLTVKGSLTVHDPIYMDGNEIDDVTSVYFLDGSHMETAPHLYEHRINAVFNMDGDSVQVNVTVYNASNEQINTEPKLRDLVGHNPLAISGGNSDTGTVYLSIVLNDFENWLLTSSYDSEDEPTGFYYVNDHVTQIF